MDHSERRLSQKDISWFEHSLDMHEILGMQNANNL